MPDPTDSPASATGESTASARGTALREIATRFQALRSAWGVVAPSVASEAKQAIAMAGRGLGQSLAELHRSQPSAGDAQAIAALDARLAELEGSMREVALRVSVAQLRSTLPERVGADRRGVLCLVDLILGEEFEAADDGNARLPSLDYVITLLCTGGDPDARMQDPVTLTPRLHALCERVARHPHAQLAELESEFHGAATRHGAGIRTEDLRTLRRRKMELGSAFFAPEVLRAVMTYNAATLKRVDEDVQSSQDWGVVPSETPPDASTSVFEHPALPKLVAALRRRTAGDPPAEDPIDRVAWCLDFTPLTSSERDALLSDSTGSREELTGTTILVSLMCRAAAVLEQELPAIGIGADQLSGAWVQELDDTFQEEANRRIAGDDYAAACALSDLKSRFLAPVRANARKSGALRPAKARTPSHRDRAPAARKSEAQELVGEAVESVSKGRQSGRLGDLPWARMGGLGALGGLAVASLLLVNSVFWDAGRVSAHELAGVSPFLSRGKRSDEGMGTAFVGTLDEAWSALEAEDQSLAAEELVEALRQLGVREIMIYDDERSLRIQALGSRAPTVLADSAVRLRSW